MRNQSNAVAQRQQHFNLALVVNNNKPEEIHPQHDQWDDPARTPLSPAIAAAAPDRLLTVAEVARFFHCNRETIKRQARSGKLPGFKFGKFWLFRRADIDLMISRAVDFSCAIGAASVEEQ